MRDANPARQSEIETLRAKVAEYERRDAVMLAALVPESELGWLAVLGLAPGRETTIAAMLIKHDHVTRRMIENAVYLARGKTVPEMNSIESSISRMRQKLQPYGIDIVSMRNVGWMLLPASRQRFEKLRAGTIMPPTEAQEIALATAASRKAG